MTTSDKAMLGAIRAMVGQLQDKATSARILAAMNGQEGPDAIRKEVLTPRETATVLGVTTRKVRMLARAGKLATVKWGERAFGYSRVSVEALAMPEKQNQGKE
jgi:excisionase family DNA binding protein